jgi:hypothetical protein
MPAIGPPPNLTTTQRDALVSANRPKGLVIYNTTTAQLEVNNGTGASPSWGGIVTVGTAIRTLNYVEDSTATVTFINGTVTLITSGAITYDGTTNIVVTYSSPDVEQSSGSATVDYHLYQDGTDIGILGRLPNGSNNRPMYLRSRRLTPTAGSHTFSIRGTSTAGVSGSQEHAGGGGIGALDPRTLTITAV